MDFALSIGISASADENDAINTDDADVVIVPIPPLLVALIDREKEKGAPLTRREVESLRDRARCLVLPRSLALALQARRGYADVDRDNCWQDWSARRAQRQPLSAQVFASTIAARSVRRERGAARPAPHGSARGR